MALNRDLSVLLVAAQAASKGREIDVADALAGTGARSLRIARDVVAPLVVHANDADPTALDALRRGIEANGIDAARVTVRHGDAHAFLAARRFDVVDIDPYGSPMPLLDAAVRATRHDGLLCLTATDTAALAGTYPRACRRRYDAHHGLHAAPWRSEVGVRILAGAAVRAAARFDRMATPLLSVARGHWMRVVLRIEDGRGDADGALRRLAVALRDDSTGNGVLVGRDERPKAPNTPWAGPLWGGPLHDAGFVQALKDQSPAAHSGGDVEGTSKAAKVRGDPLADAASLLAVLAEEAEAPAFWLQPDRLQTTFGPPPRRQALIERLRQRGHLASRSHMDPQGVRTNATLADLGAAWS